MKISVIVPIRNEYPQFFSTLDSIAHELRRCNFEGEIIAVFNGTADFGDIRLLEKENTIKNIKVVYSNIGICNARQCGAEHAKGEYLIFLDAQTLVHPFSFKKMIASFNDTKENLGIGFFPIQFLLELDRIMYGYIPFNMLFHADCIYFYGRQQYYKASDNPYHMPFGCGAAFCIKKDLFFSCGGYNPHFGVYGGGEPYLSYKLEMFGYTNFIVPSTCISHSHSYYGGGSGYTWTIDMLWRNFLLTSYILGGEPFADIFYDLYLNYHNEEYENSNIFFDRLRCIDREIFCKTIYDEVKRLGFLDHQFILKNKKKDIETIHTVEYYDDREIEYKN